MENVEISMKQQFLTYGVKLCITVSTKLFQSVWINSEGHHRLSYKRMRDKMSWQDSTAAAGELQQKIEANNSPGTEQFWNWKTYFFGKNKKHGHLNFQKKQETVKNKKHWNKNFSRKTRNIEARSRKTKRMEHKIECMLQTHPPKSCEMPRCRNDEIKPNAREPLNHTHACKNITWDDNVAIIITLWTEDTA